MKKLISNGNEPDALLSKALKDEKLLGFSCEDEAAYMSLMLIIGAADTVSLPGCATWTMSDSRKFRARFPLGASLKQCCIIPMSRKKLVSKSVRRPRNVTHVSAITDQIVRKLDEVVRDRLPEWEDLERIPYIRCLMKEVWRWRPPVALGHPHVTTRDLEYGGYRIPKGSRLHLNAW